MNDKIFNLKWMVQELVNEIKANGEESKYGIWLEHSFFTNSFLETIDEVIKEYNLEIER